MTMGSVPITGKRKKLPASLTDKITRRGVHDPEVAFVRADRRATRAAKNLRGLIDETYGDKAERVKEHIRRRVDGAGILEIEDAIVGLNAEADFYDEAAKQIESYKLALEALAELGC